MYDLLRQFRDSDDVATILNRIVGSDELGRLVRGVHVGLDRYWAHWFARYQIQRMIARNFPYPYTIVFDPLDDWAELRLAFGGKGLFDLDDLLKDTPTPPGWYEHCRARGLPEGSSPLYVRVLVRAPEDLRAVQGFSERTNSQTPVEFVFMPPFVAAAQASSAPNIAGQGSTAGAVITGVTCGGSVGQTMPARAGTLGGVLVSKSTGKAYGVTCAHVVGATAAPVYQPAPQDSSGPVQIGHVSLKALPQPLQPGERCTSRAAGGPHYRDVDLGLIELLPSVSYGLGVADTAAPVTAMAQSTRVAFTGRSTPNGIAETGPLCLWDEIDVKGAVHCFGDLFLLSKPRPWYVNTDLVKDGDSGAWVIRHSSGTADWWGMIIAGNGSHAYACFAENIINSCRATACGNLVLPPP